MVGCRKSISRGPSAQITKPTDSYLFMLGAGKIKFPMASLQPVFCLLGTINSCFCFAVVVVVVVVILFCFIVFIFFGEEVVGGLF